MRKRTSDLRAERCENCRWWEQVPTIEKGEPIGFCRRYPETVIGLSDDDMPISTSPLTLFKQWCGEFNPDKVM